MSVKGPSQQEKFQAIWKANKEDQKVLFRALNADEKRDFKIATDQFKAAVAGRRKQNQEKAADLGSQMSKIDSQMNALQIEERRLLNREQQVVTNHSRAFAPKLGSLSTTNNSSPTHTSSTVPSGKKIVVRN